jgi:predicted Zn-dependent protease
MMKEKPTSKANGVKQMAEGGRRKAKINTFPLAQSVYGRVAKGKSGNLFLCLSIIICLLFSTAPALGQANGKDENVVIRALQDELKRSMDQLKLKDFEKPYFIEYVVEDEDGIEIESKFGGILNSSRQRKRTLFTQVRIGSYEFDNSDEYSNSFRLPLPMPLDDDYTAIRRSAWFVTDFAYKQAIDQLASKKAAKQSEPEEDEEEKFPYLSKEEPVIAVEKRGTLQADQEKWEKQVRAWSAMFRKFPEVQDSTVSFYARYVNRYLINSEGTRVLEPRFLIALNVYAEALTTNNIRLTPSRHIYAKSFDDFPSTEEINGVINNLAQDLTKLRNAPQFEGKYIGPALFTERAAVQLFLQLLAPNLDNAGLVERLDRKVLPTFLSVIDDPTQKKVGNFNLIGDYKLDAQGVAAKPLTLVENGVLKTLLSTREPTKEFPRSNGRGRSSGSGNVQAIISNMFVQAKSGKSFVELKQQLIEACRAQGLSYGILFREIDSTFAPDGNELTVPIMAYKVYVEDGREEIIRNTDIFDLSVRELRQILAAGNDAHAFNILIGNGHQGEGIPVSVVVPSVLLDEIDLRKDTSAKERPMILTHPFFSKQ